MVSLKSLEARARTSEGGEAYVSVLKEPEYRVGVGARAVPGREPSFFVEVVLDPFPERPMVVPGRLADQGVLADHLAHRGYSLACDDAGVITCERTVRETEVAKEIRELPSLMRTCGPKARSRPRTRPRPEHS